MSDNLADWTKGTEAIVYQSCGACSAVQYFHRSFCAAWNSAIFANISVASAWKSRSTQSSQSVFAEFAEKRIMI